MKLFIILLLFTGIDFGIWSQCDNFEMTIMSDNPLCHGFCDGSIQVNPTGGTGSIFGQITNSAGAIVFNGSMGTSPNSLCAGWYYIYLYDEMGCELYDSVYLENPNEMEIILDITLPSSTSTCDGIIQVDTVLHHVGSYANLSYYWNPGGPDGAGATNVSGICYGDYTVTVNNEVGCGMTHHFSVGNLGVNESATNPEITIYPNPFVDVVYLSNCDPGTVYEILDMCGKKVQSGTLINNAVQDLDQLPTGSYLLKLESGSGVTLHRLVK